jgi:hypothetical protein
MDSKQPAEDPLGPVASYVKPIRSVLFVDDQFPTFSNQDERFAEGDRARALWEACTARGWLCDIDNKAEWTTSKDRQRIAACDLLVLDLHLMSQDPAPALSIVRHLAESPASSLVVVYTSERDLDMALLRIAAHVRGATDEIWKVDFDGEMEKLDIEWSTGDLVAFLEDRKGWAGTYRETCKAAEILSPNLDQGAALLERWIADKLGAPRVLHPHRIDALRCSGGRWLQSGNLFLAVVGKPRAEGAMDEADVLLDGLETAIKDWAPHWMACAIAASRHEVQEGAFRDDVTLPHERLRTGLLRYVVESSDQEERKRRSRRTASYLLERRFNKAAGSMADGILERAQLLEEPTATEQLLQEELLHVNAFLCSEPITRHHLSVGTVFRRVNEDRDEYWVCVSPACDMVPRTPQGSIDPWGAAMDPIRPMLALQLTVTGSVKKALEKAHHGRHIFFWDRERSAQLPMVAATIDAETMQPRLEQMFVNDRARIGAGKVAVQRLVSQRGEVSMALVEESCEVVCQVRAPYAERLLQVVGHHLSRIGVDFIPLHVETST